MQYVAIKIVGFCLFLAKDDGSVCIISLLYNYDKTKFILGIVLCCM